MNIYNVKLNVSWGIISVNYSFISLCLSICLSLPRPQEEAVSLTKLNSQPAIQPPSFNYLVGGCHFMYLPNRPTALSTSSSSHNHQPLQQGTTSGKGAEKVTNGVQEHKAVTRQNLQDDDQVANNTTVWNLPLRVGGGRKGHRFTFQSTVRQIERRKLADKLSREAEEREAQRLSELDAMQRVEQEFQKKRAREKASIRQQLRMFSLESAAAAGAETNGTGAAIANYSEATLEYSPSSVSLK